MTYEDFIAEWRNAQPDVKCHTSGSTGTPKEIALPRAMMAESARRTIGHFGLDAGSHLHSCISPEFIGGKMMAVRAEILGCNFTYEPPSNRPLTAYVGPAIDLLAVVPSQMIDILDRLDAGVKLPEIRHIIIGGSAIGESLRQRIARSGLDAWETYGMTETASHIALRKVCEPEQPLRPLHGVSVKPDEDSRLVITIDGWGDFATNDIAEVAEDGSFRILGRADNVIITGGKKVHPEQVERIVEQHLGCEVLVCAEPDEKWGERVVMIVEEDANDVAEGATEPDREGATEPDKESVIINKCKMLLEPECVPKQVYFAPIPRTENGKKLRKRRK